MGVWQIVIVVFYAMGLGIGIAEHGKEKKGKNNVIYVIISLIINLTILYKGGFFN